MTGESCRCICNADSLFSPLSIEHISIAGSASDDLTESEKMKSLMQIFGQSPKMTETADDGSFLPQKAPVAPDTSADRPLTPLLASEKQKQSVALFFLVQLCVFHLICRCINKHLFLKLIHIFKAFITFIIANSQANTSISSYSHPACQLPPPSGRFQRRNAHHA